MRSLTPNQIKNRLHAVSLAVQSYTRVLIATLFAYFFIFSVNITHAAGPLLSGALALGGKALKGYAIFVALASTALAILSMLSFVGGVLFDLSLSWTILDTAKILASDGPLMGGVREVWRIFRDMANILIIGMFVYIAISKIIGRAEAFNKLIVSLLSVAILINFSFFFTQVTIDVSNWFAVQTYNAITPENVVPRFSLTSTSDTAGYSISEAFMSIVQIKEWYKLMGTTALNSVTAPIQNIFFIGTTGILLLVMSILLFRMAFILLSRWIILIILMATSSLAFATALFPKLNKYWGYWKNGLIYNAVVGPALLLLLWVVSIIGKAILIQFPNTLDNAKLIPLYNNQSWNQIGISMTGSILFILLLWAAIRIATLLSDQAAESAGGLGKGISNMLGKIQGFGIGKTLGGAGWVGRRTLGAGANSMADAIRRGAGNGGVAASIAQGMRLDRGLEKLGGKSFDGRSSNLITSSFNKMGIQNKTLGKAFSGGIAKDREQAEKVAKEERMKTLQALKTSDDEQGQVDERDKLEAEITNGKAMEAQLEAMQEISNNSTQSLEEVRDTMNDTRNKTSINKDAIQAKIDANVNLSEEDKQTLEKQVQAMEGELSKEESKIETVQSIIDTQGTDHEVTDADIARQRDKLQVSVDGLNKKKDRLAQLRGQIGTHKDGPGYGRQEKYMAREQLRRAPLGVRLKALQETNKEKNIEAAGADQARIEQQVAEYNRLLETASDTTKSPSDRTKARIEMEGLNTKISNKESKLLRRLELTGMHERRRDLLNSKINRLTDTSSRLSAIDADSTVDSNRAHVRALEAQASLAELTTWIANEKIKKDATKNNTFNSVLQYSEDKNAQIHIDQISTLNDQRSTLLETLFDGNATPEARALSKKDLDSIDAKISNIEDMVAQSNDKNWERMTLMQRRARRETVDDMANRLDKNNAHTQAYIRDAIGDSSDISKLIKKIKGGMLRKGDTVYTESQLAQKMDDLRASNQKIDTALRHTYDAKHSLANGLRSSTKSILEELLTPAGKIDRVSAEQEIETANLSKTAKKEKKDRERLEKKLADLLKEKTDDAPTTST